MKVPVSFFKNKFIEINCLEGGFTEWLFSPGMLFGAREKWWGTGGRRERPHEGIDLCFYRDAKGKKRCLNENTLVPTIYEGEVVRIIDDFLGKSAFLGHNIFSGQKRLFTVYGHIRPDEKIRAGRILEAGSVLGCLAKTGPYANIRGHLHISVALISELLSLERLDWKILEDKKKVTLLDPLPIISA